MFWADCWSSESMRRQLQAHRGVKNSYKSVLGTAWVPKIFSSSHSKHTWGFNYQKTWRYHKCNSFTYVDDHQRPCFSDLSANKFDSSRKSLFLSVFAHRVSTVWNTCNIPSWERDSLKSDKNDVPGAQSFSRINRLRYIVQLCSAGIVELTTARSDFWKF